MQWYEMPSAASNPKQKRNTLSMYYNVPKSRTQNIKSERKVIKYMSNETKLQQALDEHIAKFGGEVQTRFTQTALKAIDPTLVSLTFYVGDFSGERWNRPPLLDGSPNPCWPVGVDAPREPEERKKFYMDIKAKQYQSWLERVESGEFDNAKVPAVEEISPAPEPAPAPAPEPAPEPKPEPSKPVEVVKTKPAPKPSTDLRNRVGEELLGALSDFIASTDSPPEDQPDLTHAITKLGKIVAEQQETIDKQSLAMKKMHEAIKGMAQKLPEMIKAEILKKFS